MTKSAKAKASEAVYQAAVERLKEKARSNRASRWELADELLTCEALLGERFAQAAEVTQLAPATITVYLSVARAWPQDKRHPTAPFGFHQILSAVENRAAVMDMALAAEWNAQELRDRVNAFHAGNKLAFDHRHRIAVAPGELLKNKPGRKTKHEPSPAPAVEPVTRETQEPGQTVNVPAAPSPAPGETIQQPSANDRLQAVLAAVKELRTDPAFLDSLDYEPISAAALALEGQWLVNVGAMTTQRQESGFTRVRKVPHLGIVK